MSEVLSDYEKQRLDNIARNQKVLIALGLVRSDAEKHQELRAGNAPKAKRQKVDPHGGEAHRAAVRRSMRLAGVPADEPTEASSSATPENRSTVDHEEARAEYELWTQRWCQKQAGATVVGTASYAHTLMRVMTMSESGLANRIKTIERACG